MKDVFDKARHWLIKKLACGDAIMMNFERRWSGGIAPKNLGPMLVSNVTIEADEAGHDAAIAVGQSAKRDFAVIHVLYGDDMEINNVSMRGFNVGLSYVEDAA